MKINYGINRVERNKAGRRKIVHQNHTADVRYPTLRKVLALVGAKHPGWTLSGYAPAVRKPAIKPAYCPDCGTPNDHSCPRPVCTWLGRGGLTSD